MLIKNTFELMQKIKSCWKITNLKQQKETNVGLLLYVFTYMAIGTREARGRVGCPSIIVSPNNCHLILLYQTLLAVSN